MHYGAWATAILGPVVLFMPPRRVGFQAIVIASGTLAATNLLIYDYTGNTIIGRYRQRLENASSAASGSDTSFLPEKAQRTQELLRRERERREAALPEAERRALQEEKERKEIANRGLLKSLWMGDAKDSWKEERRKREKEAVDEGKGYGHLIMEQVRDVFGESSEKQEEKSQDAQKNDDDKK